MEKSLRTPWRHLPWEHRPCTGPESVLQGHPAIRQVPLLPLETRLQGTMCDMLLTGQHRLGQGILPGGNLCESNWPACLRPTQPL